LDLVEQVLHTDLYLPEIMELLQHFLEQILRRLVQVEVAVVVLVQGLVAGQVVYLVVVVVEHLLIIIVQVLELKEAMEVIPLVNQVTHILEELAED